MRNLILSVFLYPNKLKNLIRSVTGRNRFFSPQKRFRVFYIFNIVRSCIGNSFMFGIFEGHNF